MSSRPYAFVGDLHGRSSLLQSLIANDRDKRYHYVFLGDILHHKPFFTRCKRSSPIRILKAVYDLIQEGRGTLVIGNNEDYILQSLVLPDNKVKKREVKYTLKCLRELPLTERLAYINMLSSSPCYLELDGGYRLAHAYYPHETQQVPRAQVLSGPGYLWFRDKDLAGKHHIDPSYQYYFGHYGLPYRRQNINIIDVTSLEGVGVYYTDRDEFVVQY